MRELPWRTTKDPYRIWVSEVMLQQTTVGAVLPRYARFLERFPDVAALSRAREDSVVAEWSGLGYYSRARNLHRAARLLVREHGGEIPQDLEGLRALPGVGEYMAAAVASLAFGVRAPAADANVTRILSRLHAIPGPVSLRAHRERVRSAAVALLPARNPGDLTAALMDLGQSICLPRRPRCGICPIAHECAGARTGDPERYPEKAPLARMRRVFVAAAHVESGGRVLLVRRGPGSWLSGTWAFPAAEGASAAKARLELARILRAAGFRFGRRPPLGRTDHTIVRRRLEIEVLAARRVGTPAALGRPREAAFSSAQARWFTSRELDRGAVSTLTRKIARASGFLASSN
jgi:A/G-specific adenine glycosylase